MAETPFHDQISGSPSRDWSKEMLQQDAWNDNPLDGNIPLELTNRPQWVGWKYVTRPGDDKPTKRLYSPVTGFAASHADPDTWGSFSEAYNALAGPDSQWDGAGFVFAEDDPYVGVDLDKVRDPNTGGLIPGAQEVVDAFEGAYIEPSPSETGVHIIAKGHIPFENGKTGTNKKFVGGKTRIEAYNSLRFFTVTGKGNKVDSIAHKQDELDHLYNTYLRPTERVPSIPVSPSKNGVGPTDEQILQRLSAEKNGKASRLLKGDIEGYESMSEADLALCSKIAFYTGGVEQIERIWLSSGLMRGKLDRTDYVDDTVKKAMKPSGERFDWNALQARALPYEPSTNGTKESDTPRFYTKTDTGNAERLVDTFGHEIRWVEEWKTWVVWDRKRWIKDSGLSLVKMAGVVARNIHKEAAETVDTAEQRAISKWAFQSQNEGKINSMISIARSYVRMKAEKFDTDPWLLNVQNGTLDLRTEELREHNPSDYLTKITPGKYDPHAEAPRFERFLSEVFCNDQELSTFVQRFAGYTLTGSTRERCMAILYGSRGRNGKTSLVELFQHVLGDYAKNTDTETVLTKKYSGISNDVAALAGARFVSAAEIEAGRQLAEAKVKNLTGSDTVTARFLHAEFFDFKPQFKLWLSTNNKPEIKGKDDAIWDRIKLIPFAMRFEGENLDINLPEKLRKETDGVLAWMVRGCIDWQQHGLGSAKAVDTATADYREEMDDLAGFIEERCVIEEGQVTDFKNLYSTYLQWAATEGVEELSRKAFGKALTDRGVMGDTGTGNKKIRRGITLRTVTTNTGVKDEDPFVPTRHNRIGN
jgi:putative DNA primase/helicase